MKRALLMTVVLLFLLGAGSLAAIAEDKPQTAPPPAAAEAPQSAEDDGSYGGCCGAAEPEDGWLIEALANADLAKVKAAFARLDSDPDAKALLATPEAATIRRIVETGNLPEISLEDWRKLEQSDNTARLIRALDGLLSVQRILTT